MQYRRGCWAQQNIRKRHHHGAAACNVGEAAEAAELLISIPPVASDISPDPPWQPATSSTALDLVHSTAALDTLHEIPCYCSGDSLSLCLYALMRTPASQPTVPMAKPCIYHRLMNLITIISRVALMQHIANQGPKSKMYVPYSIRCSSIGEHSPLLYEYDDGGHWIYVQIVRCHYLGHICIANL